MKYYYDFEFLEGKQDKRFLGIKYGKTKPTIDVISVGIVSEDNREYYAISKDFNLKEAWNRYNLKVNKHYPMGSEYNKEYWIRDNVLKPIYDGLFIKWCEDNNSLTGDEFVYFNYTNFKELINKYGKTNKQIAEEIKNFVTPEWYWSDGLGELPSNRLADNPIKLYGYYSDYDHVALSWLFGKMIDLPNGFPMYTIDLKQESDRMYNIKKEEYIKKGGRNFISKMSNHLDYPIQTNEHNALADAKWNKELYEFLNNL